MKQIAQGYLKILQGLVTMVMIAPGVFVSVAVLALLVKWMWTMVVVIWHI